jgi:hypothetical protein
VDLSGSGLVLVAASSDHWNNLSCSVKNGEFRDLVNVTVSRTSFYCVRCSVIQFQDYVHFPVSED